MAAEQVAVILGSDSDLAGMQPCLEGLEKLGIDYDVKVLSAHRSPEALHRFVKQLPRRGCKVIIAGAGGAAHLAGVVASPTTLPVIGVPMHTSSFKGLDSLLSTLQMPSGVPVATMAVGKAGAANAAIFAARILALGDVKLRKKLQQHRRKLASEVLQKNRKLRSLFQNQNRS